MNIQSERAKQLRHVGTLAVIILLSLAIKIANEGSLSYWLDEGYTAWFAELSFRDIWLWLPEVESHPPVYYTLVKLWGLIVGGDTWLWHRSLSIFISLLLLASSYISTRNAALLLTQDGRRAAFFSNILICFSPVLVWYSIEARPYILLFFTYSLAIFGLISILSNDGVAKRQGWILFTVGALLINWSHNLGGMFTAVLFLSLFVHWIVGQNFRKNFQYQLILSAIIVLALSAPLIIQIGHQLIYWDAATWLEEPSFTGFIQTMRRIFGFGYSDKYMDTAFGDYKFIHVGRIGLGLATGVISLGIVLYGLYKMVRAKEFSLASFFLLSCFAVPVISVIISLFGPNIFLERTLLPCLIPYFMLLSISIEYIDKTLLRNAVKCFYVVVLALGLYATLHEGKKEPWSDIVADLSNEVRENDAVLLLPNDLYLPVRLYIKDPALTGRIESVPAEYPAVKYSDFYPDGFPAVPGIRTEDAGKIRSLTANKSRVFLITREERLFDPNGITREVLSERFSPSMKKSWDNIHLERFDRK